MIDLDLDHYAMQVEALMERRQKNGTLLSSFDLIAGASILYFLLNKQEKMPAKWVFAMVRNDMLPSGLLEKAQVLEKRMRDLEKYLDKVEEMADAVSSLHEGIDNVRQHIGLMTQEMKELKK